MDFYDIVRQVLEQLQRDGRTTYRALRRQFDLDDEALEDLKEELLFAHPVVDEAGRGLVWTGEVGSHELDARHWAEDERHFQSLLPAVIALLRQEGQVTYRAIKYIFSIDDALLEEIREELILRRLAIDDSDKVLVWTGETQTHTPPAMSFSSQPATAETAAVTSRAAPTLSPSVTDISTPSNRPTAPLEDLPADAPYDEPVAQASTRTAPEAERRQLTVMFCDLADSTQLSQQLDPEDLREVIRAYQATAADVIQQYGGHIAQYLGDGLLIYFGWPTAHEDDAQRALHASLGFVDAITTTLNPRLSQEKGVTLTVRLGVHTGPVVVGQMGDGGRQENLATGETVNIAARLEGLAAPNTVLISNVTARLTRDAFELEDLGPQVLKGIAEPINVFQVFGPQDVALDDEGNLPDGGVFLVGRDEEMGLLMRRWQQSKEGLGQVVLISGEAGIGKSSLVTTVRQQVRQEGCTCMTFRCSPYHTNSALYPVIEYLQRRLHLQPGDTPVTRLDKLERGLGGYSPSLEVMVPLFADLLTLPVPEGRYAALNLSPQQQRQQTQDVLVGWLLEEAERRPTLTMWEDLHWADPSTLELLGLILEQTPTVPMLHVLTYRPAFEPPWSSRSHMTPVALNRLERPQVEALMLHLAAGKSLPAEVVEHIVSKTDGVPLYVEELTRMLLSSNLLQEDVTQYTLTGPLSTVAIPDTLQDSLMARLDRLGTAKEVAQVGSVIGREFTYEMLQAVAPETEATLQANLAQLVEAELLYQRGRPPRSRYIFKHALTRDAAYATLLKRTRQQMHQRIAACLVERFSDISATQPELVAQHYSEASCPEQAVSYWWQAVERARQRHAYVEAIEHCTRGIVLLTELPETPDHIRQEIMLQAALGALLTAVKGFAVPEAKQAYERARQRCQQLGDTSQLFPVLVGLCLYYVVNTAYRTAQELVEQLLNLAEQSADSNRLTVAHYLAAAVAFFRGDFQRAQVYATQGIDYYDTQHHAALMAVCSQDPGVGCHLYLSQALQLLGYADHAEQQAQAALDLAQTLNHPFTYGYAQLIVMRLYRIRHDWERLIAMADTLIDYADEHGFGQFPANCLIYKGYALARQGHIQEGSALLQQRNARVHRFRAGGRSGYGRMDLCEMDAMLGQQQQAIKELDNLLIEAEQSGGEFPVAEFHRLKGDLLLQLEGDYHAQAESCFHQALDIARHQQAKSWELRAATSLARLWQSQGKRQEAYELLEPVYEWFTEGLDTADLKEAKELLSELA